jgi:hypothetical protein
MSVSSRQRNQLSERARELQERCLALAVELRSPGPGKDEDAEKNGERLFQLSAMADAAALMLGLLRDGLG